MLRKRLSVFMISTVLAGLLVFLYTLFGREVSLSAKVNLSQSPFPLKATQLVHLYWQTALNGQFEKTSEYVTGVPKIYFQRRYGLFNEDTKTSKVAKSKAKPGTEEQRVRHNEPYPVITAAYPLYTDSYWRPVKEEWPRRIYKHKLELRQVEQEIVENSLAVVCIVVKDVREKRTYRLYFTLHQEKNVWKIFSIEEDSLYSGWIERDKPVMLKFQAIFE